MREAIPPPGRRVLRNPHVHALDAGVLEKAFEAALAAESALADTAEGDFDAEAARAVDRDVAGVDPAGGSMGSRGIGVRRCRPRLPSIRFS
jgi:purine nucleoside permease